MQASPLGASSAGPSQHKNAQHHSSARSRGSRPRIHRYRPRHRPRRVLQTTSRARTHAGSERTRAFPGGRELAAPARSPLRLLLPPLRVRTEQNRAGAPGATQARRAGRPRRGGRVSGYGSVELRPPRPRSTRAAAARNCPSLRRPSAAGAPGDPPGSRGRPPRIFTAVGQAQDALGKLRMRLASSAREDELGSLLYEG
eukprot:scaffold3208_cov402-Prasinococcus_capsulatus_cf.AAC.13